MRGVIFYFYFFSERGGGAHQTFFFFVSLFSRPRAGLATCKVVFFGLATNALNVRNNNNNLRRKVNEKSCVTFLLCDPGWYVHKPDVQNKWEKNTTHTHSLSDHQVGKGPLIVTVTTRF